MTLTLKTLATAVALAFVASPVLTQDADTSTTAWEMSFPAADIQTLQRATMKVATKAVVAHNAAVALRAANETYDVAEERLLAAEAAIIEASDWLEQHRNTTAEAEVGIARNEVIILEQTPLSIAAQRELVEAARELAAAEAFAAAKDAELEAARASVMSIAAAAVAAEQASVDVEIARLRQQLYDQNRNFHQAVADLHKVCNDGFVEANPDLCDPIEGRSVEEAFSEYGIFFP